MGAEDFTVGLDNKGAKNNLQTGCRTHSPSAVRPFLVDCPSGRPSKRRTFEGKAKERRRINEKTAEDANCALSISMPTGEITIFFLFDATKVRNRFYSTKLFGQKYKGNQKIISDKPGLLWLFTIIVPTPIYPR